MIQTILAAFLCRFVHLLEFSARPTNKPLASELLYAAHAEAAVSLAGKIVVATVAHALSQRAHQLVCTHHDCTIAAVAIC